MRTAFALFLLAVVVRGVVAARTLVPARDSEAYLWMAERVAEGDLGAAFRTVFHPLYSILTALPLRVFVGLDPVVAGQLVSCGLGALAVFPLYCIGERLGGRRAAVATGAFYALGIWFARYPADCLSEGPFFLAVASCATLLLRGAGGSTSPARGSLLAAGACAGLAYGLRPEGAALLLCAVPWLVAVAPAGCRGAALAPFAAGFVAAGVWWPIGWTLEQHGLTLTPKAAFTWSVGVGDAESGVAHWFTHALQLPAETFEAIGYGAVPLALLGLWRARPRRLSDPTVLLIAPFVLQCAVVPFLQSNIRFLAGFGVLLLPLSGVGAAWSWERLRARPAFLAVCVLAVFAGDLVRIPQERRADRVVLRELGAHLRPTLSPGQSVATEMPRLAYFLGLPPIPPRRIERREILEACRRPEVRYAIVVEPRTGVADADLRALGFAPVELPDRLRKLTAQRGMLVFGR